MSWKDKLYGVRQPSTQRVVILNFIIITCGLWWYGWQADFVPSSKWSELGMHISIASTAIFISSYYWALATGRTDFRQGTSAALKILVILFLPVIIFFFFLISITHGIADIATQAFGTDKILTAELSKHHQYSRRSCQYRLNGYEIENAMPNYICVSEAEYSSLPEVGTYLLQTKETSLGLHISSLNSRVNR
jgi:hypothetical protein